MKKDAKKVLIKRPNGFLNLIVRLISKTIALFTFKNKIIRNEMRGKKGPMVILANHQCALDVVNIYANVRRRMNVVMSLAFYETLPFKFILKRMNYIPKQQFQTTVKDIKLMKNVVDNDGCLLIFPAGLMCENGLSTPIPSATYKFLKFINADVYMARSYGTYFVNAKWRNGIRRGRTYLDIYKLFDKEDLSKLSMDEIENKTKNELLFDAYSEQEVLKIKYKNNRNIEGLENVLYTCPHCHKEYSISTQADIIKCSNCGFEEKADDYGFLSCKDKKKEIRHVSDWDCLIYERLKRFIEKNINYKIEEKTDIHMIENGKFVKVGSGNLVLDKEIFSLHGLIKGEELKLDLPTNQISNIPFVPGKNLDIQVGAKIYRCYLEKGIKTMKFLHLLKIFNELSHGEQIKNYPIKKVPDILYRITKNILPRTKKV